MISPQEETLPSLSEGLFLAADRAIDRINRLQSRQVAPGPTLLHTVRVIEQIARLGKMEAICGQSIRRQRKYRNPKVPERHLVIISDSGYNFVDAVFTSGHFRTGGQDGNHILRKNIL